MSSTALSWLVTPLFQTVPVLILQVQCLVFVSLVLRVLLCVGIVIIYVFKGIVKVWAHENKCFGQENLVVGNEI